MSKSFIITRRNGDEHTVLVDDADYDEIIKYSWHIMKCKRDNTFYVSRSVHLGMVDGKRKRQAILLHRQLLGLTDPKIFGDHINHNGLDNRRENIREATSRQNQHNQKPRLGVTSKYKGVSWSKQNKKWSAGIGINGKRKCLGHFDIEEDARDVYEEASIKLHKDFKYND